jgi:hypothetical protein
VTADPYEEVDHARMEYLPACSSFFRNGGWRKYLFANEHPVTFFSTFFSALPNRA